jgi:hypothetical protein
MNDWFRGDGGELIEVRYLHIPDMPADEVDEIVCGPMHLETLSERRAYLQVAGLKVNILARRGRLSITCEPANCTRIDAPTSEQEA